MRGIAFEVEGRKFELVFRHVRGDKVYTLPGCPQLRSIQVATEAIITTLGSKEKDGEVVARGIAFCSSLDNFEKEKGRKVAIERALREWGPTTGVKINMLPKPPYRVRTPLILSNRRKVWAAYHGRKG